MTPEQMRQWLIRNSPYGASWDERVRRMSDTQVAAVYARMINKKEKK